MKSLVGCTALLVLAFAAQAETARVSGTTPARSATTLELSASQRAGLVQKLSAQWGDEVVVGGRPSSRRADKIARMARGAPDYNLIVAAEMPTYQSMLGALQGQPLDSPGMIKALDGDARIQVFGSAIADTVYTPLPMGRCRVADSRVINLPTAPALVREINVEDVASYGAQGGDGSVAGDSSTLCGLPTGATAYVVSVTVLPVGQEGFFKVFENGKSFKEGNTLLYSPTAGQSNDVVVRSCQGCTNELSIYSNSQTHYVLDVIGYFMPPQATALQCTSTFVTQNVVANDVFDIDIPSCPAGYAVTGAGCRTPGFNQASWAINGVFYDGDEVDTYCSGQNTTAGTITVEGTAQCCRVPGR